MPVADVPGQDAEPAKYVPVDIRRLCGILGYLEQLLCFWYAAPFLGLFHPIINKDMEVSFSVKRSVLPDSRQLCSNPNLYRKVQKEWDQ